MEEDGAGGGWMSRKVMGIPMPVLVIGAALIAYFLFFRNKGGGSQGQLNTTGNTGTDTLTSGATTVDSGAIQVTVNAGQPKAKTPDKDKKMGIPVPNVVGLTDTAADAKLKAAGFKVHDTNEPKGGFGKTMAKVKNESPKGGSKAPKGSVVDLTFATSANRAGKKDGGDSGEG